MKLKELADIIGAELSRGGDLEILGVAGIRESELGQITYLSEKIYFKDLEQCRASAAFVPMDTPDMQLPLLRVKNPKLAFARAMQLFHGKPYNSRGISDKAVIGKNVTIGVDCSFYPFAVVEDNAFIGDRVTLYPGVFVGEGSRIGDECLLYPNVYVGHNVSVGKRVIIHAGASIGSDGFGYVTDGGKHHKIPQVGSVLIEDDVEVGANSTIDRATLGTTVVRKGTKIDNLVQVAHNVTIGEHCILAGQVGIAGSTTLGNYVVLGGGAGTADHLTIGDGVMAGGRAAIAQNVEAGQVVSGFYAMPVKDWLRVQAVLPKLPELKKTISKLEKQIQELNNRLSEASKGEKP